MNFSEQQFQIALIRWADTMLTPPAAMWATPNGGLLPGATVSQRRAAGALRKAMGVRTGFPDLCVMWPGGFAGLELKAPPPAKVDKSDPDQLAWRDRFDACGWPWAMCRTFDEVEAFLRDIGVPLRLRAAA